MLAWARRKKEEKILRLANTAGYLGAGRGEKRLGGRRREKREGEGDARQKKPAHQRGIKADERGIRAARRNREGMTRGRRERGGEGDAPRDGDVEKEEKGNDSAVA